MTGNTRYRIRGCRIFRTETKEDSAWTTGNNAWYLCNRTIDCGNTGMNLDK